MNKILVKVCVPATSGFFDMFVPTDVSIREVISVMTNGVAEITNGRYLTSGSEQLCLSEPAGLFNPSLTLGDYGVTDGTLLYLI